MTRVRYVLVLVLSGFFFDAPSLLALDLVAREPVAMDSVRESTEIREKLSPVIEALLLQNCGEDCPSFQVEPVFGARLAADDAESLGFSVGNMSGGAIAGAQELRAVSVKLLIHPRVPLSHRQTLKEIVGYRLANEVSVPINIHVKELKNGGPFPGAYLSSGKVGQTALALVKEIAWPLSLLMFALVGFFTAMMILRHRRQMALDSARQLVELNRPFAQVSPIDKSTAQADLNLFAADLIQNKALDLAWWIEDLARSTDKESLGRVLSILPAEALTKHLSFTSLALERISSLDYRSPADTVPAENRRWIYDSLNAAHWRRKEEEANPLVILKRLSESQLLKLFGLLEEGVSRAALLSALPQSCLPTVLGGLTSDARVRLGADIAELGSMSHENQMNAKDVLSKSLTKLVSTGALGNRDAKDAAEVALDEFALYLSPDEGKALAKRLDENMGDKKTGRLQNILSAEALIATLDQRGLAEICMRMDFESLRSLLALSTPLLGARVLASLPKTLQERLSTVRRGLAVGGNTKSSEIEARQLKARFEFLTLYREVAREGLVQ